MAASVIVYWDEERSTCHIDNDTSGALKETVSVKADAIKVIVIAFPKFLYTVYQPHHQVNCRCDRNHHSCIFQVCHGGTN